jgi:hypothetical protein
LCEVAGLVVGVPLGGLRRRLDLDEDVAGAELFVLLELVRSSASVTETRGCSFGRSRRR